MNKMWWETNGSGGQCGGDRLTLSVHRMHRKEIGILRTSPACSLSRMIRTEGEALEHLSTCCHGLTIPLAGLP